MPPRRSKETLTLSTQSLYRHVLVYAPPGWALFEVRVEDGKWQVTEWSSGRFNFGDDVVADMKALDEFVILMLRFPNARVYFEDEMGNERMLAWLEYAMHRLRDEPRRIVLNRSTEPELDEVARYSDEKLKRWGYTDRDERARDAIKLAIKAIAEWKEEEARSA